MRLQTLRTFCYPLNYEHPNLFNHHSHRYWLLNDKFIGDAILRVMLNIFTKSHLSKEHMVMLTTDAALTCPANLPHVMKKLRCL